MELKMKIINFFILMILSISMSFQVNAVPVQQYGQIKAKIGETKTYEVTTYLGNKSGRYFPINNFQSTAFNFEKGVKFTVVVTNLTSNPFNELGLLGYYNVIITQKDNSNITTKEVEVADWYTPFLMYGFDNASAAENFTILYNKYSQDPFNASMSSSNSNEMNLSLPLSLYVNDLDTYEYLTFNWKTGWLDKFTYKELNGSDNSIIQEIIIEPFSRSNLDFMNATVVLVLTVPALMVLERRKKKG